MAIKESQTFVNGSYRQFNTKHTGDQKVALFRLCSQLWFAISPFPKIICIGKQLPFTSVMQIQNNKYSYKISFKKVKQETNFYSISSTSKCIDSI